MPKTISPEDKYQIPPDIQKQMLDFFMQTSIPRRKRRTRNNTKDEKEKKDSE